MTKTNPLPTERRASGKLLTDLSKVRSHLADLRTAARDCGANVSFGIKEDLETIPFLDADLIYRAMPTYSVSQAAQHSMSDPQAELFFNIDNMFGPHTLNFYVMSWSGQYVLPPGTQAELARKQVDLNLDQRKLARTMWDTLTNLAQTERVDETWKVITSRKLANLLRHGLRDFVGVHSDLQVLDNVISNSRPLDELIERRMGRDAIRAFWQMHARLQADRPKYSVNNYYDAFNTACVVHVYNNSSLRRRLIPVLITQTRTLLDNADVLTRCASTEDSPILVSNRGFLGILASLRQHFGARERCIGDFVYRLEADAQSLQEGYGDFATQYHFWSTKEPSRAIQPADTGGGADALLERRHPLYWQWQALLHQSLVFSNTWSPYLSHLSRLAEFDRATMIDRLVSPEIDRLAEATSHHDVHAIAERLRSQLRNTELSGTSFLKLLIQYKYDRSPYTSGHNVRNALPPGFELSQTVDDGRPLTCVNANAFVRLDDMPTDIRDNQRYRFCIHHQLSGKEQAILAIDVWRLAELSAGLAVRIIWLHNVDSQSIWDQGAYLIWACTQDGTEATQHRISYRIFAPAREETGSMEPDRMTITNEARGLLSKLSVLDYFELDCGLFTFLADTEPLAETELQAGIIMPAVMWSPKVRRLLADAIANTSRWSFTPEIWEETIDKVLARLLACKYEEHKP